MFHILKFEEILFTEGYMIIIRRLKTRYSIDNQK